MRFRLYPTESQAAVMVDHCAHARFLFNLALEQANLYRRDLGPTPGHLERNRQLTEARADFNWLAAGSQTVQQQALRDSAEAMRNWWAGTHRRPTWRKHGVHEGFRQVGVNARHVERLNRRWGRVHVPKVGWVRFRWTRDPASAKSYRVTLDASGRWHVAFAVIPEPISGPENGSIVGIDRGIALTLALSDGSTYAAPLANRTALASAASKLSRAKRGSANRRRAKRRVARLHARTADARKDFVEKSSTTIARSYDLIRVEHLNVANMVRSARGTVESPGRNVRQKAGLNRSILEQGWTLFETRLGQKASGRVEKVNPAYTSQRCSACGNVDANSRKSQALFVCTSCAYTDNADVNAAKNIAAGHAVTARGGLVQQDRPVNCEPQLRLVS